MNTVTIHYPDPHVGGVYPHHQILKTAEGGVFAAIRLDPQTSILCGDTERLLALSQAINVAAVNLTTVSSIDAQQAAAADLVEVDDEQQA